MNQSQESEKGISITPAPKPTDAAANLAKVVKLVKLGQQRVKAEPETPRWLPVQLDAKEMNEVFTLLCKISDDF